jgi:hypothetical protein
MADKQWVDYAEWQTLKEWYKEKSVAERLFFALHGAGKAGMNSVIYFTII